MHQVRQRSAATIVQLRPCALLRRSLPGVTLGHSRRGARGDDAARSEVCTHLACGDEGADFVVPDLKRSHTAPVGAGAPHRAAFHDFLRGIFQVPHHFLCLLCRQCAGMHAPQSAPEHPFADNNLLYPQLGRWRHLEKLPSYQCVVRTTSWLFPATASDTISL